MSEENSYSISRLNVTGLFGRFNHKIEFDKDQNITIITAPNGYGKTVLLRIIDSVFNFRLNYFWKIEFESIEITLDTKQSINIYKDRTSEEDSSTLKPIFIKAPGFGSEDDIYKLPSMSNPMFRRYLERYLPVERIGRDQWYDNNSNRLLSTSSLIEIYVDQLPEHLFRSFEFPEWLKEAFSSVDIHLVKVERLLVFDDQENIATRSSLSRQKLHSVVQKDAKHLSRKIRNLIQEYAKKSQMLDQTFPKRIIDEMDLNHKPINEAKIKLELDELEKNRSQLKSVGLLDKTQSDSFRPKQFFQEERVRKILEIYIEDMKKKLGIFDEMYEKIRLFKQIITDLFYFKAIEFDKDTGFYFMDSEISNEIPLSDLSSGEQHELVVIYDLLFKAGMGAMILIDEPELSLHVAWQRRFISDLQKIQKLTKIKALIVTHSPQIIHDRWDLVQDLANR
ncbi:MAG: AAA family ATPase [Paracoccaceae bacterium]|nr:AAA family ATPase [Paracoccaceae bacterium]MDE2917462.1 AAA family ATPase [Paracoccaceae bacterium]